MKKIVTRPLTLDQKIAKTEVDIKFETKNIWACSYMFVAAGAVGFFTGINASFNARTEAAFVRDTHQLPWGNPNFTNWTVANSTRPDTDRVELVLYDLIRQVDIAKSCVSLLLVMMGLTALAALRRGKAVAAQKAFQRTFFTFFIFLTFFVYSRKAERNFDFVVKALQDGSLNGTYSELNAFVQPEPVTITPLGKDSDQCKADHPTEDGCNSDAACTWCKCAAVPSRCWSVEDAKRLPAAVYVCDKKQVKDDPPPSPQPSAAWPTPAEDKHWSMLFFTFAAIYLVSLLKFIEKSYAKNELFKYAKTLVKLPAKKAAADEEVSVTSTQLI